MYTVMICENNLQPDLFCLDYRAVRRLGRDGPSGFGAIKWMYPSIRSNIPVIPSEESNVYSYDL
jgi:hypothetical protein